MASSEVSEKSQELSELNSCFVFPFLFANSRLQLEDLYKCIKAIQPGCTQQVAESFIPSSKCKDSSTMAQLTVPNWLIACCQWHWQIFLKLEILSTFLLPWKFYHIISLPMKLSIERPWCYSKHLYPHSQQYTQMHVFRSGLRQFIVRPRIHTYVWWSRRPIDSCKFLQILSPVWNISRFFLKILETPKNLTFPDHGNLWLSFLPSVVPNSRKCPTTEERIW